MEAHSHIWEAFPPQQHLHSSNERIPLEIRHGGARGEEGVQILVIFLVWREDASISASTEIVLANLPQ